MRRAWVTDSLIPGGLAWQLKGRGEKLALVGRPVVSATREAEAGGVYLKACLGYRVS